MTVNDCPDWAYFDADAERERHIRRIKEACTVPICEGCGRYYKGSCVRCEGAS